MLRATLHMKVKSGCDNEFVQAWRKVAAYTSRVPGNLRQALLQSPHDPTSFIITSDWESQEAFQQFERSETQHTITAPLRAMRESVHMEIYHLIESIEKGAIK